MTGQRLAATELGAGRTSRPKREDDDSDPPLTVVEQSLAASHSEPVARPRPRSGRRRQRPAAHRRRPAAPGGGALVAGGARGGAPVAGGGAHRRPGDAASWSSRGWRSPLGGGARSGRGSGGRRRTAVAMPALCLALAAGAVVLCAGASQTSARAHGMLPELARHAQVGQVEGTVVEEPTVVPPAWPGAPERVRCVVSADAVSARGRSSGATGRVLVLGPSSWAEVPYGARVSATGSLRPGRPGGRVVAVLLTGGAPEITAPPPPVAGVRLEPSRRRPLARRDAARRRAARCCRASASGTRGRSPRTSRPRCGRRV